MNLYARHVYHSANRVNDGISFEIFVLFYKGPTELSRRFRSERVESPTGIRNVNSPRTQNRKFPKVQIGYSACFNHRDSS